MTTATATESAMARSEPVTDPQSVGFVDKLRLFAAAAVAVALMWMIGWLVAAPADPQMAVTFTLRGTRLLMVLPPLLVLVVVTSAVGTVLAGPRWPEGGCFAMAVGLAALALRGGSMQVVLAYYAGTEPASRRALMMAMGFDVLCWTLVLGAGWVAGWIAWRWLWPEAARTRQHAFATGQGATGTETQSVWPGWSALAITTVVALLVIWMTVARTPVAVIARGQVIASVAAGLYLGALAARYFTGVTASEWYALAVPAVGGVGFLMGYLQANMSWATGPWASYTLLATPPPHTLARPLPVEYLAVGVAAVLIGFWSGQNVEHAAEHAAA